MIPRLKARAEFLAAAKAPYQARGAVVVQARRRPDDHEPDDHKPDDHKPDDHKDAAPVRVGFTATKKIGNAVARNRAKRRLREAAEQMLPLHALPGYDYVFIARAGTNDRDWQGLLDDVKAALIRLARPRSDSKSAEDLARPTGRPS